MTYALLLVFGSMLCLAGVLGYYLGLNQSRIVYKLRTLEGREKNPPAVPTVTMGAYETPKAVSTAPDNRSVGLVEAKTPELVEFETKQKIDKQALGR